MTHRTKEPPKDSIRARLGESGEIFTIAEMRAMVNEALCAIECMGIKFLAGGNLYINPRDQQGHRITRIGRTKLEDFTIRAPYRSAADEHKVNTITPRGPW